MFTMSDIIQHVFSLPVPFNMVVVIVAIVSATGVITGIVKQIRNYACLRNELDFKRELVDRGMTAEEIEQIVKARSPRQFDDSTLR
jgi:Na+/citrate or Na+/malate symporter